VDHIALDAALEVADPLRQPALRSPFKARYGNFIGGAFVDPVEGRWFDNVSPITGDKICEIARSGAADIEKALDAAHAAKDSWGRTSVAERAVILNRIADRMEAKLDLLALAETWDNGKPIRETTAADLPLAIDHFRYFAGCIRAQEGGISEIDRTRSPTISTSHWASSAKLFRGTSRS
jgi:aldehyde dehydrogenase